MTRIITNLSQVAGTFDAIVLDQWGVLHDGSAPYPGAIAAVKALAGDGTRLAILSNSGKRSAPNADRIAAMGFPRDLFETVMTSGEALWRDLATCRIIADRLFPIERVPGEAKVFCDGLPVTLCADIADADAILLMGLPDDAEPDQFDTIFAAASDRGTLVLCANPDRVSPRAGRTTVTSPGTLAHRHAGQGGHVRFYGKPFLPIFDAIRAELGVMPEKLLMVGDSLEHDVTGGHAAGWSTAFVRGGLHHEDFERGDVTSTLDKLLCTNHAPPPDYALDTIGSSYV